MFKDLRVCFFVSSCLFLAVSVKAQDYSLLASNYYADKGDSITYTLFQGRGLDSTEIAPEAISNLSYANYIQGGKKVSDTISLNSEFVKYSALQQNNGQSLLTIEFKGGTETHDQLVVEDFAKTENLKDLASIIDSSGFTTEYTANTFFTAKALTRTEKHNGNLYKNKECQQLEIVLEQNPYRLQYGDDITAVIFLAGKPLEGASATIYTKSITGQVHEAKYRSNGDGKIYFKLNRSGLWLLQTVYANPSEEDGVDYNYYQSSFSFSFQ
ncbi:DUF4198 domain-containing protein [Olivibacter sp. SDN3]|uniref:DUF4198 domain-containing protein n=1 Tax=Olivibacter sp. SDN3 TaxID=2764720 RepID=UPI0016512D33|nr:DUF4198 domain-containing protein [Olivibacter sp. SDN3]QNL50083.1 DUF4198 domain-containing protein [Olivibacter sp. SDN3]